MDKLAKIRKLLALAGESPATPEQKAAYQKARELLNVLSEKEFGELLTLPDVAELLGLPMPITKPSFFERLRDVLKGVRDWVQPRVESIPWHKFYQQEPDDYVVYEIVPTPSVRNNQAAVLAKVMATFYRKPADMRKWGDGALLTKRSPYRCNFRIVMKAGAINFYLLLPRDKAGEVLRKAEAIYDSGITIQKVDQLPKLDPAKVFCTELGYKKHDIFSLDTDARNNYPLPSLLTAVRTLEGDDVAIFDAMLEPSSYAEWYKEAKETHRQLEKGYVPDTSRGGQVLRSVHAGFAKAREEIGRATRFGKKAKAEFEKHLREEGRYQEAARIRQEMTAATKRKGGEDVLKAWLRVAVQSDSPERAQQAAYTVANAWKDITGDNELERHDVPTKWAGRYLDAIETRKGFSIRFRANKMSVDEAGKLLQLPGRELIEEFPQIQARKLKDIDLPTEITRTDIKRVRYGYVTVRGVKHLVGQPLEAWKGTSQSAVYDALCTTTFTQGKQGSGKSEGNGAVWAYDMVLGGFTAVLIDTADGQMLRNFVDSLPADYPEEKLHLLNADNHAWPIALGWDDVYGRDFKGADGDAELQALEIQVKITTSLIGFINSLSSTGEFTDRMKQYVTSCMKAITTQPGWSFLDLELALTSLSYREELLGRKEVRDMPEVVTDLEELQRKAYEGKETATTGPILSRLKALTANSFLENMFYQPPKLQEDGKPVLDLRRIIDNPEGGYGHVVCIQASPEWGAFQGVILGFFDDKVNFNVYSRIEIDQSKRKPFLKWWDEAHKVREFVEERAASTGVEFRKYRGKQLYTNHSIEQMGKAADRILDGGAAITSYKTERLSELSKYMHRFKPYTKAQELYDALPDKWVAINAIRLPSGQACPAFIADMAAPPEKVKDRSAAWEASAKKYGRPWKEVRAEIQGKRQRYQALDKELEAAYEAQQEAEKAEAKRAKQESRKTAPKAARKKAE